MEISVKHMDICLYDELETCLSPLGSWNRLLPRRDPEQNKADMENALLTRSQTFLEYFMVFLSNSSPGFLKVLDSFSLASFKQPTLFPIIFPLMFQ